MLCYNNMSLLEQTAKVECLEVLVAVKNGFVIACADDLGHIRNQIAKYNINHGNDDKERISKQTDISNREIITQNKLALKNAKRLQRKAHKETNKENSSVMGKYQLPASYESKTSDTVKISTASPFTKELKQVKIGMKKDHLIFTGYEIPMKCVNY